MLSSVIKVHFKDLSSLYFFHNLLIIYSTGKLCHLRFPKGFEPCFCGYSSFYMECSLFQGFSTLALLTVHAGSFLFVVDSLSVLFSFLYPNIPLPSSIDNILLLYLLSNLFQLHFLLSYNLKFVSLQCVLFAKSELYKQLF